MSLNERFRNHNLNSMDQERSDLVDGLYLPAEIFGCKRRLFTDIIPYLRIMSKSTMDDSVVDDSTRRAVRRK